MKAAMNEQTDPAPDEHENEHALAIINLLQGMVALAADPKASAKKLQQLADAHGTARTLIDQAASDRAAADAHKAAVEAEIAAARERHGEERDRHQAAMREREQDIAELERKAAEHLKSAQEHEERAKAVRTKLEQKLAALAAA